MNDEFYIGWEAKAPPTISGLIRKIAVALLLLALLVPIVLAVSQRLISAGVFEWGHVKTFSGILQTTPYPHLLVARPGNVGALARYSTYNLVATWKYGLDSKSIAALDGQSVNLKGTLIYRDNQTMIETKPEWIQPGNKISTAAQIPNPISLGKQTLVGEIVDSKCFLGVMNPGQLAPHRACAIRCISGGVPPVFVVRQKDGAVIYLLLVSSEGKPVNQQILDRVAEPLEITGEVMRQGDSLILRADPAAFRRL